MRGRPQEKKEARKEGRVGWMFVKDAGHSCRVSFIQLPA